jgi:hypothetical protein
MMGRAMSIVTITTTTIIIIIIKAEAFPCLSLRP